MRDNGGTHEAQQDPKQRTLECSLASDHLTNPVGKSRGTFTLSEGRVRDEPMNPAPPRANRATLRMQQLPIPILLQNAERKAYHVNDRRAGHAYLQRAQRGRQLSDPSAPRPLPSITTTTSNKNERARATSTVDVQGTEG